MRADKGFAIEAGKARFGDSFQMRGVTHNLLDLKVSSKDTEGNLSVFVQKGFTPNDGPPLHVHSNQDEMFFVVGGEYYFRCGEEEYYIKAGDLIFLPKGVPHAFIQLSEYGKMLVQYQPAGKMEDFFKKTAMWTEPPSTEEINALFEEHGMNVVGPPLKLR